MQYIADSFKNDAGNSFANPDRINPLICTPLSLAPPLELGTRFGLVGVVSYLGVF